MLGLPLMLAAAALGIRWLRARRPADLLLAAFTMGSLFESKVFALIVLAGGAMLMGALLRRTALFVLGLAGAAAGAPWALLTGVFGSAHGRLRLDPLRHVVNSLYPNSSLWDLTRSVGHDSGAAAPFVALVITAAFVIGALGLRLLGLPRALRLALRDRRAVEAWLLACTALGIGLSLLLVGDPVAIDGAQFQGVALFLGWCSTAVLLARWLRGPGLWPPVLAVALIALAVSSPLDYLAHKRFPEQLSAPDSVDRAWVVLSPATVAGAEWVERRTPVTDRLLMPVGGPRLVPLRLLYVGLLAGRRLLAASDKTW